MPNLSNNFSKNRPKISNAKGSKRDAGQDVGRDSATDRGYGARWKRERAKFLSIHPLCAECEATGRVSAATVVDHIRPHRGNQTLFWDINNWQPLCHICHNRKSQSEVKMKGVARVSTRPKWLKKSLIPVKVITGAPCSGKSTYAKRIAKKRTLVIDLDDIITEISGTPPHQLEDEREFLNDALYRRNQLLGRLAHSSIRSEYSDCIFVVSAPLVTERRFWREKLGAKVFVLQTSPDTCLERLEKSDRKAKKRKKEAIFSYFKRFSCDFEDFLL